MITMASKGCSRALVEADCLPVLLELIVQTNRSQAALVVVAGIIRILANITKVSPTLYVWTLNMYIYTEINLYNYIILYNIAFLTHTHTHTHTQWRSTSSSVLQCPNSMIILSDLVYKVHNSQTPLLLATLQLMVACTSGNKVQPW